MTHSELTVGGNSTALGLSCIWNKRCTYVSVYTTDTEALSRALERQQHVLIFSKDKVVQKLIENVWLT